jgi:pimeloyl-ACP methyl ester carboxylesterase
MSRSRRLTGAVLSLLLATTVTVGLAAPAAARDPAGDAITISRLFDVGGHRLYLSCRGAGSPTVVYLHGAITDDQVVPHRNAFALRQELVDDHRVCLYDRRNVGRSDTVDATQSPQDAMRDLETLLDVAGIEPPYLLLGASFGGLLGYLYANEHPDDVTGMVLLDAMFPDELALDRYWPRDERYKAFDEEDREESLERISHWRTLKKAARSIGHEPPIPVVYLASRQEMRNTSGIPEYDERILDVQEAFVARFSPGTHVWVDAPHFMEPAIPGVIADSVRDVAASSRQ